MEDWIIQFDRPPELDAIPMERRYVATKSFFGDCMGELDLFFQDGLLLLKANDLMLSAVVRGAPELSNRLRDFLASRRLGSIAPNAVYKAAAK